MDLTKARELLQFDLGDPGSVDAADLNEAKQMAIKAIDRILFCRRDPWNMAGKLLKGETHAP